ncbi:MAG TPA: DHHA1 domain-containing protein, partial [Gemmataceae bacterium]
EAIVNRHIQDDLPVTPVTMPLKEAQGLPGVRAVFGEKYPDPVRVVMIGPESPDQASANVSIEFCGGTHLSRTGQIGLFKIISQEPVSKGVRRVTAVTGPRAFDWVENISAVVDELTARLNCKPEELPARVEALQEEVKRLQTQLKKGAAVDLAAAADRLLAEAETVGGARLIVGEMPAGPVEQMRAQVDRLRQKAGPALIVFAWSDEGKVGLLVALTKDLVEKGLKAGELIKPVAQVVGGSGGGKPDLAQAGGKDPSKIGEALRLAKELGRERLGKT